MPLYEYRCKYCNRSTMHTERGDSTLCASCGRTAARRYSFTVAPMMHEHLNNTTGTVVSSHRKFKDDLARQSEEASVRTGIEHDFQPLTPSELADASAHGVTDEGMDATRRHAWDRMSK